MTLQPWWGDVTGNLTLRVGDEAYQRHRHRVEVERSLRSAVSLQALTVTTLQQGFDQIGHHIADLHDTLSWSLETIADAIQDLTTVMSWGFAEVIWQQEQTNELLREVLKTLSQPRGTAAAEQRQRGNEFYANALNSRRPEDRTRWMDLALDAYRQAAEHNPADFSVFYSLGTILFFEKGNSEGSLRCFREAAVLAEPYSARHAAMSWMSMGYIHRNRREVDEAYRATANAVEQQPDWPEALYQHAVHCAQVGREKELLDWLSRAIDGDPINGPRVAADSDLLPFHEVRKLLDTARSQWIAEVERMREALSRLQRLLALQTVYPFAEFEGWPKAIQQMLKRLYAGNLSAGKKLYAEVHDGLKRLVLYGNARELSEIIRAAKDVQVVQGKLVTVVQSEFQVNQDVNSIQGELLIRELNQDVNSIQGELLIRELEALELQEDELEEEPQEEMGEVDAEWDVEKLEQEVTELNRAVLKIAQDELERRRAEAQRQLTYELGVQRWLRHECEACGLPLGRLDRFFGRAFHKSCHPHQ